MRISSSISSNYWEKCSKLLATKSCPALDNRKKTKNKQNKTKQEKDKNERKERKTVAASSLSGKGL